MMPKRILPCLLACAALALPPVYAADQQSVRRDVQAGKLKPLAEILRQVQAAHLAQVLSVDLETDRIGQIWYEIELMGKNGQPTKVYVDPTSGAEISPKQALQGNLLSMGVVLRRLLATQEGFVRRARLKYPPGAAPQFDVRFVRPDGSEQRYLVDALSGQVLEQGRLAEVLPAARPMPELIEAMEDRYGARAVEVKVKRDAHHAPYLAIELQTPNGRRAEVIVDPASDTVLREVF